MAASAEPSGGGAADHLISQSTHRSMLASVDYDYGFDRHSGCQSGQTDGRAGAGSDVYSLAMPANPCSICATAEDAIEGSRPQ